MCQWNGRELLHISCWKFIDFSLSRNLFDLDTYLLKRKVLRASKRDLEREISITVDRDWIFFLLKFSKYSQNKEQRLVDLEEFFLDYQDRLKELSIHSIKIVIRFFRAIKLCKRFYKLFQGIITSASFDQSMSPLVLILDISDLTGCLANRGEPTNEVSVYAVISGPGFT